MDTFPSPLVTSEWLVEHREGHGFDSVRVVDVRWGIDTGPQRDAYLEGHIPGAVFADLDIDLSDPVGERGRHPLPSAERFATVRKRLGIDRPVIAYDHRGGAVAARLWWMLDSIGHPVAVLDEGIEGWDGPLEAGEVVAELDQAPPAVPWPADRFIDADDVLGAIDRGALLLDARSAQRFAGESNPIDARPGHIPGSVSNPWTGNLGEDGRLAPAEALAIRLRELGLDDDSDLLASCGSGVTGCHNLLAARVAGHPGGRLYVGSWSHWSLDPERPIASGLV